MFKRKALVALGVILGVVLGMPAYQDIEKVAEYVDMLQATGKYPMIYDLFDVNKSASEELLKQRQAQLLKKCYAMRKTGGSPLGEKIEYSEARLLIINGYKILTDKALKEAYEWLLNEAPADFMEGFRRRKAARKKVAFTMPSGIFIVAVVLCMWGLCDVLSTFLPIKVATADDIGRPKKKARRERKEKKPVTIRDTFTYRAGMKIFSLFSRGNSLQK